METLGAYRLVEELARGASGVVYRALGPQGETVALKVVTWDGPQADARRRRFAREGAALQRLKHPGVVRVHDVGELGGKAYLAMDLLEGASLQRRLELQGALPIRQAALLCAQLAEALEYVHEQGLLHRDLKPANVLMGQDGSAVLTDFGLVKDLDPSASRLSRTGVFLGTPGYWAPEQMEGDLEAVDARSDVYGLGATLYALLTGRPPFQGDTLLDLMETTQRHQIEPPQKLRPEVPPQLEAICLRCLAREPDARYPSAAALAEALRGFLAGEAPAGTSRGALLGGAIVLAGLAAAGVLVATAAPSAESVASPVPRVAEVDSAPAPSVEPDWPEQGRRLQAEGQPAAALALYDRWVAAAPDDVQAWLHRGLARCNLGGLDEGARDDLTRVLDAEPDRHDARLARGVSLRRLHDYAGAIEDLERATELRPDSAKAWIELGVAREEAGDLEGALVEHSRGLALKPDDPYAYMSRGNAKAKLGNPHGAEADYGRALELDPDYSLAWFGRGALFLGLGNHERASQDLAKAVRCDPNLAGAWYALGIARRRLGEPRSAIRALERALELKPDGGHGAATRKELAAIRAELE